MIRNICKDELFLARKSELATPEDLPVAHDLLETLIAHQDGCVGMAANMIGVSKRIIAVENQDTYLVLFNPVILKKTDPGRTPFGFIVPRAHKHRYRLQWPLSRKRQRTFLFPLRSHNSRKRDRYRKFLPLSSTGQASHTPPNLFSFCTRSRSRVRRRQACTAAQNLSRRPLRSWCSPDGTGRGSSRTAPVPSSAHRCRIW